MPRYRRARTGTTYFFTVVTNRRRPILCDDRIRLTLRQAIETVRRVHPFSIDGWVLLPDHMHCIWTMPEGDNDYSMRWHRIKRYVSVFSGIRADQASTSASARKHREAAIWQRRFWEHQIRDERDLENHLNYIHYNAVRHGYSARASDWPYSTFHRYVRSGAYPEDWAAGPEVDALDFE